MKRYISQEYTAPVSQMFIRHEVQVTLFQAVVGDPPMSEFFPEVCSFLAAAFQ